MKASTVSQIISQFDENANNSAKTILKHKIASTMLTKKHLVSFLANITDEFGDGFIEFTHQQLTIIKEFRNGSIDVMDAIFGIIDSMDDGSADALLELYDDVMDAVLEFTE